VRVLIINSTYGGVSGSGRHVQQLVEALRDRVKFELWNINTVGCLDFPKLRSISFYLKCKMKGCPDDIDVIHIHNPKFAGLCREGHVNVLTIHGDYKTELKLKYGRLAKPVILYIDRQVRKANVITTVSPYWAKLRGWRWIPNMIDLRKVEKIPPSAESYILFVGRDDPIKNYPLFRELAKRAYKELGVKSLALGPLKENTEYLKHNRVPWKQVVSYMKSAYALVITSKQEGFPTTILEAWASGCPVVAHNIPPLVALAEECPGSMLLFNNAGGALKALKSLGENYVRENLVKKAREHVKRFDVRVVAEQYYRLYRGLVEVSNEGWRARCNL